MPRVAHKIGPSDLVVIDGEFDPQSPLAGPIGQWLFHITHAQTVMLACKTKGGNLVRVAIPAQSAAAQQLNARAL